MRNRIQRAAMVALVAWLGFATQAGAQAFSGVQNALVDYARAELTPRRTCEAVAKRKWKDVVEIKAAVVAAAGQVPAFCRITGIIKPEVAFEVTMPARWNGRFYMIGNGGHAGDNLEDAGRVTQRNAAMQLGFAFAHTNTGHDSRKEPGATFVMSNPRRPSTTRIRAVLSGRHGQGHDRRVLSETRLALYWNSVQRGRMGYVRPAYPNDFDGVRPCAMDDQTGFTLGAL